MQYRKDRLEKDYYYHAYSRSISKYIIFNDDSDYLRMLDIIKLYRFCDFNHSYSKFLELDLNTQEEIIKNLESSSPVLVEIIAYCLMPTHLHLILKQITDHGISKYMSNILNCYSRYFNINHQRTGPLWAGRFKSVLVDKDEQMLHLTRYFHLNATSAGLVKKPEDWQFSSYKEYIDKVDISEKICSYNNLFDISPKEYRKFVLDRKDYQQQLSKIKSILIDDYTG